MVAPLPPPNKFWVMTDGRPTQEFALWAAGVPLTPGFTPPAPSHAGDMIYWTGSAWAIVAGNSTGQTAVLQETAGGVPSFAVLAAASGTLVSIVAYNGSQTIAVPAGATKAFVRMWGGSGGSGGLGPITSNAATGGTGAAAYLEKYLTGLTPGLNVVYTQGAAGLAGTSAGGAGGNGTASTLASGTQALPATLTANGSNGSAGTNAGTGTTTAGTAGGTATNGDINITGAPGIQGITADQNAVAFALFVGGAPGGSLFAPGAAGVSGNGVAGKAGAPGGLIIMWFA